MCVIYLENRLTRNYKRHEAKYPTSGICRIKMKRWSMESHTSTAYTIPCLFYLSMELKSREFIKKPPDPGNRVVIYFMQQA